jgi:phosphoribosylformimino-5-aminoimidazole carboxamide ribotide isomerase
MLIPSIDLQGGRIVQLVQGEKLALAFDELDPWIDRFRRFSQVQLIDLDAAKGTGDNAALVDRIARELPCRVGGGVRSVERAKQVLRAGAQSIIVGSSLFDGSRVNVEFASKLSEAVGLEHVIGAVDARAGAVVVHGWRTALALTAVDAVRSLEPYCGGFLYTVVDREGLMGGADLAAIRRVAAATSRRVAAAGGITTQVEIDTLDAIGVDAVVGMAIYTNVLRLDASPQE